MMTDPCFMLFGSLIIQYAAVKSSFADTAEFTLKASPADLHQQGPVSPTCAAQCRALAGSGRRHLSSDVTALVSLAQTENQQRAISEQQQKPGQVNSPTSNQYLRLRFYSKATIF